MGQEAIGPGGGEASKAPLNSISVEKQPSSTRSGLEKGSSRDGKKRKREDEARNHDKSSHGGGAKIEKDSHRGHHFRRDGARGRERSRHERQRSIDSSDRFSYKSGDRRRGYERGGSPYYYDRSRHRHRDGYRRNRSRSRSRSRGRDRDRHRRRRDDRDGDRSRERNTPRGERNSKPVCYGGWDEETTDDEARSSDAMASKDTSPTRDTKGLKVSSRPETIPEQHPYVPSSQPCEKPSLQLLLTDNDRHVDDPRLLSPLSVKKHDCGGGHSSRLSSRLDDMSRPMADSEGWSPAGTTDGVGSSPIEGGNEPPPRAEADALAWGPRHGPSPAMKTSSEGKLEELRPAYSCARSKSPVRSPSPDLHIKSRDKGDDELYFARRWQSPSPSSEWSIQLCRRPHNYQRRDRIGTKPWGGEAYPTSRSPRSGTYDTRPPSVLQQEALTERSVQQLDKSCHGQEQNQRTPLASPRDVDGAWPEVDDEDDDDAPPDPRALKDGVPVSPQGEHRGWTPMITAIAERDVEALTRCLEEGMPIDEATPSKLRPIHFACMYGFTEGVRLLLESEADWRATDGLGRTPLIFASQRGKDDIIQLIMEQSGARQTAHLNGVDSLIQATALWHAASRGSEASVSVLLQHGADTTIQDRVHSLTPAGIARRQGHNGLAEQLEEKFAAQVIERKVKACESIFKKKHVDELDSAGPQGSPTAGQLQWGCMIKVMNFLKEQGAGLTSDSIWLEIGSGPMRPGVTALQFGAGAAIGVELVTERLLMGMIGGIGICEHVMNQEKQEMDLRKKEEELKELQTGVKEQEEELAASTGNEQDMDLKKQELDSKKEKMERKKHERDVAIRKKPKTEPLNWRAYHIEMDAIDIKRIPPQITHVYMFVSCPAELLVAVSEAWNACGPDGPQWLITFETEKTIVSDYEFHAEFVASCSGLKMAGSNEGKTARLYRRTQSCPPIDLSQPLPPDIVEALDFITNPNTTVDEHRKYSDTRRWLVYGKTCGKKEKEPSTTITTKGKKQGSR